jgi:NO-binding membrane sensor protein with MHYT domain
MTRFRAVVELLLACAAAVGCAASWSAVHSTVTVAPVLKDQPVTMSVVYDPSMLLVTLLLAALAGMLAVVGIARLRRARHATVA